jgi:hypothetical protein
MRLLFCLLLLLLLAVPGQALAQTDPAVAQTDPAVGQTKPAVGQTKPAVGQTKPAVAQTDPAPPAEHHARMNWEQRFDQANDSHDGHLTLAQARVGYIAVARHFHDIDSEGKGFVTEDDIRAWHKQQRAARHGGQTSLDDNLRPRPAIHRTLPGQRQFDAPTQPAMSAETQAPAPTVTASAPPSVAEKQ